MRLPRSSSFYSILYLHVLLPPSSRCRLSVCATLLSHNRNTTQAKLIDNGTSVYIVGSFKDSSSSTSGGGGGGGGRGDMDMEPDFKLSLTSAISSAHANLGYWMTGTLERSRHRESSFQLTHFAVLRKHEWNT